MAERSELTPAEYRVRTRRSLLTGGAAAFAGAMGWRWVQTQPEVDNIPRVLRNGHEFNESIWSTLTRDGAQSRTFDREAASILMFNGPIGIRDEIDLDAWEMTIQGPDGNTLGTHVLSDVQALPKYDMTIEHKCIEGWAQITNWGGARFSDFMALYQDQLPDNISEVYLETPDGDYYVSVDLKTMLHEQTLLVYEMLGQPLDQPHGAPLRLATPLKYGIKQLKRIGLIQFRTDRGGDYWGERGYDWYAGF